jgi:hypothetical protein
MKILKLVLGIVVAILALAGVFGIIRRLIYYDGSAFELGGLAGSIVVTLLAVAGSIMLFKSALKKTEKSSVNDVNESN